MSTLGIKRSDAPPAEGSSQKRLKTEPTTNRGGGKGWKKGRRSKRGGKQPEWAQDGMATAAKGLLDDFAPNEGRQIPSTDECGWDLTVGSVIDTHISTLSSFGDGLAVSPSRNWMLVVPFTVPGDRVRARIYRHEGATRHSLADLVEVLAKGEWRDDSLVQCKYFGKCSGCQYQMISYEQQLEVKRNVVANAFRHASGLEAEEIPPIGPTLPSPKQFGYRTKLTPHFNALPKKTDDDARSQPAVAIGFEERGRKRVMDIEQCPLATPVINDKLVGERKRIQDTIHTFKKASTLHLRDSSVIPEEPHLEGEEPHICITTHHELVTERVGRFFFRQNAGSFFQNNNSILPSLLAYVGDQLRLPSDGGPHYLVDTYCGSGLFGISLAHRVTACVGIEISADSIKYARANAEANGVKNCIFHAGQAEKIFDTLTFPADRTTIIIDPPRKGCDQLFLDQLSAYGPTSIIYVSCNVHTQARDAGILAAAGYSIESIRGADLFPQSHHCESIAVMRRKTEPK